MRRNVEMVLSTNGKGIWSNRVADVKIVAAELLKREDGVSGTLNVYFDPASWDVQKHDLIYTDPAFLLAMRDALPSIGIRGNVNYNEQGMQGDDYVSFDVWGDFDGFKAEPEVSVVTDYKVERVVLAASAPATLQDVNPLAAFEMNQVQDAVNRLTSVLVEGGKAQQRAFFAMRDRAEAAEARVRALEAELAKRGQTVWTEEDQRGLVQSTASLRAARD